MTFRRASDGTRRDPAVRLWRRENAGRTMFGPKGSPQARNLFDVIAHLQPAERLHLYVLLKSA